jgi:hypothetical protein
MEGKTTQRMEPEVIAAIHRITNTWMQLGEPTPVHEIKSALGAKRHTLDHLLQDRVIQECGENYLPCLRAITEFEDRGLEKLCFGWTELILKALRLIYVNEGEKDCTIDEVTSAIARRMEHVLSQSAELKAAMLFATEFSGYFASYSRDASGAIKSIRVTDGILDFDNIAAAWEGEAAGAQSAPPGTTRAGAIQSPGFSRGCRFSSWSHRP